jgi:hypothetical protein
MKTSSRNNNYFATTSTIILLALFATGCASKQFTLTDINSTVRYGPYDCDTEQTINIDNKTYRVGITDKADKNAVLINNLKSTIIPTYCCKECSIETVVETCEFFAKHARHIWNKEKLTIHVIAPQNIEMFNLPQCKNISLYFILESIQATTSFVFTIENGEVWLRYKEDAK